MKKKIIAWMKNHKILSTIIAILIVMATWILCLALPYLLSGNSSTPVAEKTVHTSKKTTASPAPAVKTIDSLHAYATHTQDEYNSLVESKPYDGLNSVFTDYLQIGPAREQTDVVNADRTLTLLIEDVLAMQGPISAAEYDNKVSELDQAWDTYQSQAWQAATIGLATYISGTYVKNGGWLNYIHDNGSYPQACNQLFELHGSFSMDFRGDPKKQFEHYAAYHSQYENLQNQCFTNMTYEQQVAVQDR